LLIGLQPPNSWRDDSIRVTVRSASLKFLGRAMFGDTIFKHRTKSVVLAYIPEGNIPKSLGIVKDYWPY